MSAPSGGFGCSVPSETNTFCCCAFLCDNDGQVIRDLGVQLPSSSKPIAAGSLLGLIESGRWLDFLETVRIHGAALRWETKTHYESSARSLQLHGAQTPCGILVFGTLTSGSAALKHDQSTATATGAESSTRSTLTSHQHGEDIPEHLLSVAHDLNNPISSIISSCEYLVEYSQENLDTVQVEMIGGIEASARTLLQLSSIISRLCTLRSTLTMTDAGTPPEEESLP
jgi:signal transduction histidine kinase